MEAIGGDDDGGRASKKKAFNKLIPSSVHKVLSNDDLLIEILVLLPVISLSLFKRVSKRWLSLITSPSFIFRRTRISAFVPPSGLFIAWDTSSSPYDFLSFDSKKLVRRSTVFAYNSETSNNPFIIQSCNGLLLCSMSRYDYTKPFVYNPLTSVFKMLPPVHPLDYYTASCFNFLKMAFDPTKSPHYKVLRVGAVQDVADVHGYCFKVQTYCSETGVWTVWDDRFPSTSFFGFGSGVYCNGAIHWFSHGKMPFHFKLEFADRLVLTKIQSPVTLEGKVHSDRKLFGSYGSLLLLCKDYYRSQKLYIYEMKNGYSEWSIKYIVDLDNMLRRTWKHKDWDKEWDCYNLWSIFLGEREEDSFMVIELFGKVLQYKFGSKTVTMLLDLGEEVGQIDGHDFIASFAQL